ncbi:MAG: hypothetical protein IPJ30_05155 [Acidobacteria bacterium]|nr:hypothetical protein [Acidobacteriota bacterium]
MIVTPETVAVASPTAIPSLVLPAMTFGAETLPIVQSFDAMMPKLLGIAFCWFASRPMMFPRIALPPPASLPIKIPTGRTAGPPVRF